MENETYALTINTVLCRSENQLSSEMDGESIIMSTNEGSYYGTDEIGHKIWSLLESPISIKEICDQLMEEYLVQREECETDVLNFVRAAYSKDLLQQINE